MHVHTCVEYCNSKAGSSPGGLPGGSPRPDRSFKLHEYFVFVSSSFCIPNVNNRIQPLYQKLTFFFHPQLSSGAGFRMQCLF